MVAEPEAPQRITQLTPLDRVQAIIAACVAPVAARTVNIAAAFERILAADVAVKAPIPASALAIRDGFAVRSEQTTDAGGYAPAPLSAAMRIDVGEPLPPGTDAVAPLDTVAVRDGEAQALAPVGPGDGVLPPAADAARGETLITAGRRLGRVQVALLSAAGIASVQVREPCVRLVRARRGRDAVLDAALACIGGAIESTGGVEWVGKLHGRLEDAMTGEGADAVIVIGGTGSGRNDATVRTIASLGQLRVHGIGLIPGETAAFGIVGGRPVLALPGRLDAALAVWHLLGRPLLSKLAADSEPAPTRLAKLTHKLSSPVGFAELVPVHWHDLLATPIASGYVPLAALARANGWIFVGPQSEGYPAHSEVVIRPWP